METQAPAMQWGVKRPKKFTGVDLIRYPIEPTDSVRFVWRHMSQNLIFFPFLLCTNKPPICRLAKASCLKTPVNFDK
ncbi:hypothetical protein ABH14_16415 [Brevibacillus brevis]|nr:hypothetical protein [Brevibacillus brevis]